MNAGESIGFVGAGLMGRGMALNLLRAGHPVTLYVRRQRAELGPLLALGAEQTGELGALAAQTQVIILCVDNAQTVSSVVDSLLPALRTGQLLIDATTSDPVVTREVAAKLHRQGVDYADAPVTGGPLQAAAGTLGALVGCAESSFPRIREIVASYAKTVQRIGEVGSGHYAKLLNNFVTQGTTALLAEAYCRARDNGVDWRALYAVMEAGAARSGTLEKMVKPALDGDFDGSQFSVRNALKDLGYFCRQAADSARGASPLAEEIRRVFAQAAAAGLADRYVSALLDPDTQHQKANLS